MAVIINDFEIVTEPPPEPAETETPEAPPRPIHLGFRLGTRHLRAYLQSRQDIGVNHVALNLRFNQADVETTLKRLADDILPDFPGRERQHHAKNHSDYRFDRRHRVGNGEDAGPGGSPRAAARAQSSKAG